MRPREQVIEPASILRSPGSLVANQHDGAITKGALLPTRELLTAATGRPLDPAIYKAHLKRRYLDG